jgi:hypothetical protein
VRGSERKGESRVRKDKEIKKKTDWKEDREGK